ncbi:glycosyltransferase [Clostridium sp. DJ247]|uniref:glycosyltransferase n=1 Tax=Clostridium sp. DJ247 TaxID=2726188 RepID=UPI0016270B9B|nr:glycosyltransferase [Clostridium sp. DJ247]MBC2580275.1 glycosyltransferase [Clostridium sp. DJ247]
MRDAFKTKSSIDVSVVIPCKNEITTLKSTVNSIIESTNDLNYEIIIVDDASEDLSTEFLKYDLNREIYKDIILVKTNNLGVAGSRNAGAKASKGKYLFFCDAHIKVPDRWLNNLVNTLKEADADIVAPCIVNMSDISAAGYGMTWDEQLKPIWLVNRPNGVVEIPFVSGCTFGITNELFKKVNGFDHFFQVYGSEDFEICLKAWLYGYRVVLNPHVKVQHLFKTVHSYRINTSNVIFNILCLAYSHFGKERLSKTINILKNEYSFSTAASDIKLNSELILKQREKYFNERIYNDDFFFKKFNIPF